MAIPEELTILGVEFGERDVIVTVVDPQKNTGSAVSIVDQYHISPEHEEFKPMVEEVLDDLRTLVDQAIVVSRNPSPTIRG